MTRVLFTLLIVFGFAAAAQAQQSRYSQWSNPDPGANAPPPAADGRLQEFLDRLNKLVDDAEKARAADPKFLKDLRDLAAGQTAPTRSLVLADDFSDGDFTRNPAWQVTDGTYFIEQNWGLRNKVQAAATEPERKLSNEEKALKLFGAILSGKTGGGATATTAEPSGTAIHTPATVPNAFALEAEVYSVKAEGRFAAALYQGADRSAGYRLVYSAGQGLELQRFSPRGTAVIDATRQAVALEDKKFHRIGWTRSADGSMTVGIDGAKVIQTRDLGFRDPFQGVALATRGGDFIVKSIRVFGAP